MLLVLKPGYLNPHPCRAITRPKFSLIHQVQSGYHRVFLEENHEGFFTESPILASVYLDLGSSSSSSSITPHLPNRSRSSLISVSGGRFTTHTTVFLDFGGLVAPVDLKSLFEPLPHLIEVVAEDGLYSPSLRSLFSS